MVLFQFSFLEKNSPGKNSLFSLSNFLKVKPKVSTCNVAAPILLYIISYDLTTIISNIELNTIGININVSRDLCVWCDFLCISHSLSSKVALWLSSQKEILKYYTIALKEIGEQRFITFHTSYSVGTLLAKAING